MANDAWLIFYSTEEEKNGYFSGLALLFNDQDNLQYDSEVYVLNGSINDIKLFEVYCTCEKESITMKKLATFQNCRNDKNRIEFVWNRRKSLMQCQLKFGYVSVGTLKDINKTIAKGLLESEKVLNAIPIKSCLCVSRHIQGNL